MWDIFMIYLGACFASACFVIPMCIGMDNIERLHPHNKFRMWWEKYVSKKISPYREDW